ncbi:hypothetical protein HK101_008476 [Irineochytrium annulatum]|nr:hypothetical protein HK101_008476 [Irineochytrium annulatum]
MLPNFAVAMFVATQVALYYGISYAVDYLDPSAKKRKEAKQKSSKIFSRLGVQLKDLNLNEHEEIIATEVIHPEDIKTGFKEIGGLDEIIDSLKETVIYPLCYPKLFEEVSGLLGAPKGVLLYGPPGCGKTLLARALAHESGATFINLHLSTLTEKWYGESQKLCRAVFTLAAKLSPTIIFIDEIDSFLRERRSNDHEATSMMKAEFMALWDGLTTGTAGQRVVVLGATNRPNDIDRAILRRMPKRFAVRLPDVEQRRNVLRILLGKSRLEDGFDMAELLRRTEGFSGSDLKELCRNAAMVPVREAIRGNLEERRREDKENGGEGLGVRDVDPGELSVRALRVTDFFAGELTGQGASKGRDGMLDGLDLD